MSSFSAEVALSDTRHKVAIYSPHTLPHVLSTYLSTMFFLPILSLFCTVVSSSEPHCYNDQAIFLTTLASCFRAFDELQEWVGECGASPRDFGPAPVSSGGIPLPQLFIDPQRSDSVRCGISISWAPGPRVPPPAPSDVDRFSPTHISLCAGSIMRTCLYSHGPSRELYPLKFGFAWIRPHQWVVVKYVLVHDNGGNSSDLGSGNGNVTVVMGNGANTTVDASIFNPSTCGSPITLPNDSGNASEAVVAA